MAERISLKEYAVKHEMHYKTALRNFKDRKLKNVSDYFTEDAGDSVRYSVTDNSPNYGKVIDTAKEIIDLAEKITKETNKLKKNLEL